MQEDFAGLVDRLLVHYASSVAAKDTQRLMDLYDPDVRIFDAWDHWSHEGAEAWRTAVERWFDLLGSESVRVTFDDTRSFGAPEFAMVTSIVTYAGISARGEELRSMQNRVTWGVRLSTTGARIVHEHTSVPVGSELEAILKRG